MATKEDADVDEVSSGVGKSCRCFAMVQMVRNTALIIRHPGTQRQNCPATSGREAPPNWKLKECPRSEL